MGCKQPAFSVVGMRRNQSQTLASTAVRQLESEAECRARSKAMTAHKPGGQLASRSRHAAARV